MALFSPLTNWLQTHGAAGVHEGSWAGLPDFGITEARASELSGGQTTDLSEAMQTPTAGGGGGGSSWGPADTGYNSGGGMSIDTGGAGTSGSGGVSAPTNYSFGDPNTPDLSNPVKQTDYDNFLKSQTSEEDRIRAEQERRRGEIGGAWDTYIGSLQQQLEGLGTQRTAQEGIVGSQYRQGADELGLQKTQGDVALGAERTKSEGTEKRTLRDMDENLRNLFRSGTNYLGTRGAGDSSAANQYSYALSKLGSQQRTDVKTQYAQIQNEINQRSTNLKNIFDKETRNLGEMRDQKLNQVTQWFSEQQGIIQQQQATGQLNKAQDIDNISREILDRAMREVDRINAEVSSRGNALQEWAMSNSSNIQQLVQNMQGVSNFSANNPQYSPLDAGMSTDQSSGKTYLPGSSGGTEEKDELFGSQQNPFAKYDSWI